METINTRLQIERTRKKLSQQELADKVGCNRSTISMIETGKIKPSYELAKKLESVLKIKWYKFFY